MKNPGVALPLLLAAAGPSFADRSDFAIEYFDVRGTTSRQLNEEIGAKGPVSDTGRRSDGYTRWHISWRYDTTPGAAGCTASNVVVDLDIRMTLPRWDRPRTADPELVRRWDRYIAALRVHEDGHRYRADAAAGDVRRALQRERGARDCRALESRLNALANQVLARLAERQEAYDRETDFGAKQGVIRP